MGWSSPTKNATKKDSRIVFFLAYGFSPYNDFAQTAKLFRPKSLGRPACTNITSPVGLVPSGIEPERLPHSICLTLVQFAPQLSSNFAICAGIRDYIALKRCELLLRELKQYQQQGLLRNAQGSL